MPKRCAEKFCTSLTKKVFKNLFSTLGYLHISLFSDFGSWIWLLYEHFLYLYFFTFQKKWFDSSTGGLKNRVSRGLMFFRLPERKHLLLCEEYSENDNMILHTFSEEYLYAYMTNLRQHSILWMQS